ncbi:MAG: sulfite exporter TauE/SafE family protein [Clostridia bacterium]|nr:sulfite exporter TauE/SafE family protein [Clostridia bacterium]
MKNRNKYITGFLIGLINSLIGACGGIITVAALKKDGMEQNKAHANAIAVILPLSIISAIFYHINGFASVKDTLIFLPGGIAGAIAGGILLPKIPQKILKKIFAVFIIWAGIRMVLR